MSRGVSTQSLIFSAIAALLILLPISRTAAAPGGRPGTNGAYHVLVRGDLRGEAKVVVTPQGLKIDNVVVRDAAGGAVTLTVKWIPIEDSRFAVTETVNGQSCQISGRVDAAEGSVLTRARLSATLRFSSGECVRVVGDRSGN